VPRPTLQAAPSRSPLFAPIKAYDLCHPVPQQDPFTRHGWIFELKHDGFRALARSGRSTVQLLSRSGRSMSEAFLEIVVALEQLPPATLDGELSSPTRTGAVTLKRCGGEASCSGRE